MEGLSFCGSNGPILMREAGEVTCLSESFWLDKFKEAARQAETDDDEERFNKKLKRIAKTKRNRENEQSGAKDK